MDAIRHYFCAISWRSASMPQEKIKLADDRVVFEIDAKKLANSADSVIQSAPADTEAGGTVFDIAACLDAGGKRS